MKAVTIQLEALRPRLCVLLTMVLGLSMAVTASAEEEAAAQIVDGYLTVEWPELMPKSDLDALINPPEEILLVEDGSAQDQITSQLKSEASETLATGELVFEQSDQAKRYQQALVSTTVVPEYNGKQIRIAAFVVPLAFGEGPQDVTEFFLVPYFGACIHVPPPPPNQIIFSDYQKGFALESLSQPYWVYGKLVTELVENDTATAAYSLKVDKVEPYMEYGG